jgi:hypothetical protein
MRSITANSPRISHSCVSPMRDPKGLLLEISVAVRDRGPLLAELFVQASDRNTPRVRDARQRGRSEPFLGEEREVPASPVADDLC